jgi:hypothetical protein
MKTIASLLILGLCACSDDGDGKQSDAAPGQDLGASPDGKGVQLDGPTAADGPAAALDSSRSDANLAAADSAQAPTSSGIVITEMLINPDKSNDAYGEWVELKNTGTAPVTMTGWTLEDTSGSSLGIHFFDAANGTITIQPGQYLVMGSTDDTFKNGGVALDYVFGKNWFLVNDKDQIILKDDKKQVVDSVAFDETKGWTIPKGASLSLKDETLDNNDPKSWCEENSAWTGSSGDKGTPGAKPGCK